MNERSMKKSFLFVFAAALVLLLARTFNPLGVLAQQRPVVAVTIPPQAAFVREVAGDRFRVITVLPPGSHHDTFQIAPQDMESMAAAKLYLSIGMPPERANLLPKLKELNPAMKIVDVREEVAKNFPQRFFAPDSPDTHIWLSPRRAVNMLQITANELSLLDPANQSVYQANAANYIARIQAVDRQLKETFRSLPNKTFIVYHPAFGYFADEYGLTMVALEDHGKEAHAHHFREVVDLAREKGIKVVFYQSDIDGRQSKSLAEEIGGRTEKVDPLALDYVENLQRMAETFAAVLR